MSNRRNSRRSSDGEGEVSGGTSKDKEEYECCPDAGSNCSASTDREFELERGPVVDDRRVEFNDDEIEPFITKSKKKQGQKGKKSGVKEVKINAPAVEAFEGISGFEFVNPTDMKKGGMKKHGRDRPVLMWHVWEEDHSRWIDNYMSKEPKLDQENELKSETHGQPSELCTRLYRFQREWLSWALKQEESAIRGGILADEMGMGKTVQTIALVLAKREIRQAITGDDRSVSESSSSSMLPQLTCTLVVCPTSALHQWEREIQQHTRQGTTKVLCYQGPRRVKDSIQFHEFDFVITTYSTVETDYRGFLPLKQRCTQCGRDFNERQMVQHLNFRCWRFQLETEKQSKRGRKGNKSLSGKNNSKMGIEEEDLENFEIEHRKSALHCVKWERIVLDEAHCIKDSRRNTAQAIFALESSYKWSLSGTPVLNRVGEIYSLIRFLQIVPYSYYFCKECDCRVLNYSSSVECQNCNHKASRHFCWWFKNVATPLGKHRDEEAQRAMILVKHKILPSILLRRTKSGRASDLALPPRIISVRRDTLDVTEESLYRSLSERSRAYYNIFLENGTFAAVYKSITRLRQAVNHPYLALHSRTNSVSDEITTEIDSGDSSICLDPVGDLVSGTGSQRTKSKVEGFKSSSILNRIQLDVLPTSTKIEALREEVRFMIERDGSAKGIVFSQFIDFLNLIMYSLQKSGVTCVLVEGSMAVNAREDSIRRFNEDPVCRIFLISLQSGGVALDLTVASHVFMMDPWWNAAIEQQAMDRIHRIGQYKPIRIVRFVIEGTIEERLLELQERKQLLFEGTVGGSADTIAKMTKEDLMFLLDDSRIALNYSEL